LSESVSRLASLTAGDLMNCDVKTVGADEPLGVAARELARLGIRGAPVVDETGRCVGVLSVSDLARWAACRGEPGTALSRTCAFQQAEREPGGRETVTCRLADGYRPFQRPRGTADGRVCTAPHCVPIDWQVVEVESAPAVVRDVMTTEVVSIGLDVPVAELARLMLDRGVHRRFVLDSTARPVGVVSVNQLFQILARSGIPTPGAQS
jgi:CBS domain-containing protein